MSKNKSLIVKQKPGESKRILIISDTQAPAHHPDAIEFITDVAKRFKPTHVCHIGDELDLHNLSKYAHDPDLPSAKDELEQGLTFMRQLYDMFPEVQVCISNHGARPYLRAKEIGLPSAFIRSYKDWMQAPSGWTWHHQILIDNIAFIHGEGLSGDGARLKACTLMQKSCVFGHIHSNAGVSYFSNKEQLTFGFNVGCLIDLHSPYFEYNRHQMHRPIIGLGIIQDGIPIFVPMVLDKYARWVGRKDKSDIVITKHKEKESQNDIDDLRCGHCGSPRVHRKGLRYKDIKSTGQTKCYGQKLFCNACRRVSTI